MFSRIIYISLAAAAALILSPTVADAYGAAHVGYTHVGPNGVYHAGETAVAGPGGVRAGGSTTAVGAGGSAYHSSSVYEAGRGGAYGATNTYHYSPSYYGGGTTVKTANYAYVR